MTIKGKWRTKELSSKYIFIASMGRHWPCGSAVRRNCFDNCLSVVRNYKFTVKIKNQIQCIKISYVLGYTSEWRFHEGLVFPEDCLVPYDPYCSDLVLEKNNHAYQATQPAGKVSKDKALKRM